MAGEESGAAGAAAGAEAWDGLQRADDLAQARAHLQQVQAQLHIRMEREEEVHIRVMQAELSAADAREASSRAFAAAHPGFAVFDEPPQPHVFVVPGLSQRPPAAAVGAGAPGGLGAAGGFGPAGAGGGGGGGSSSSGGPVSFRLSREEVELRLRALLGPQLFEAANDTFNLVEPYSDALSAHTITRRVLVQAAMEISSELAAAGVFLGISYDAQNLAHRLCAELNRPGL